MARNARRRRAEAGAAGIFGVRRRRRRFARAFTLLELLLVVMILAVIVSIAIPNVGRSLRRMAARDAASSVASNLRYAQARAISTGRAVRVTFSPEAGTYRITQSPPSADLAAGVAPSAFVPLPDATGRTIDLPDGVRFDEVALTADDGATKADALVFAPDGRGGHARIRLAGGEQTFTIATTGRLGQVILLTADAPKEQP